MEHPEIVIIWICRITHVRRPAMKLYSYVIPRDYGFAPNPYFNYCTLATCKPRIRKSAQIGDWIAGYGAANSSIRGKLVVLMQVGEIETFDEYWEDNRFTSKRPVFNKGILHMYGDNIYHHIEEKWVQEYSHHSMEDGSINYANLKRDTQTDKVLIATDFYYFGNNAIDIPEKFSTLIGKGRNHSVCRDEALIEEFINYVNLNYDKGIQGIPYSRQLGKFAHYRGEK